MVLSATRLLLAPISRYKASLAFFPLFHLLFWKGPCLGSLRKSPQLCQPSPDTTIDDHPHARKRSEDPGQFLLEVGKAPSNDPVIHAPLLQCLDRRDALVKK